MVLSLLEKLREHLRSGALARALWIGGVSDGEEKRREGMGRKAGEKPGEKT